MELTAQGKNIPTYPIGNLFIQGECFADTIYITVDRYYDRWDLSECTFSIKGETESGEVITSALLFKPMETKLRVIWQVSNLFVQNAGRLMLELKASNVVNGTVKCVVKYDMPPVFVKPALEGTNEVLPDTSEQIIAEINEAAADGLAEIQAEIDAFDLDSVNQRLDNMDAECDAFLARPEVIPVTQEEYDSSEHKSNSLYIIIEED